jgi:hypothetical protein
MQVQDTFYIREPLDPELLAALSDHIAAEYLDGLPLLIRIVLADGTPRTARSSADLPVVLTSLGNKVAKLVLSAQWPTQQSIEIAFSLGVLARGAPACTLSFHHPAAQEIQSLLRKSLEVSNRIVSPYTTLYQETFHFDPAALTPGLLAQALEAVSARYLDQQPFTAVVTTLTGKYFSEVPTHRLASIFQENSGSIHFVQLTAQRLIGGQSCSISCYFQPAAATSVGTLSLLWGASDLQAELARFLRDKLQLAPAIAQPPPQTRTPRQKQHRLSCMILMPPDAYWSEGIWNHLQSLLQESGWDAYRPAPLYDNYSLLELQDHIQAVSWVLADVTYRHPHTMYGLGLAHALSKNTLVLSQQIRDIPPDMKALPYLVYENSIPGLLALTERFIALARKA